MLPRRLRRWIESLRYPWLVLITALFLAVDVAVPDLVPFVDELALAMITVLLARLRDSGKKGGPETGAPQD